MPEDKREKVAMIKKSVPMGLPSGMTEYRFETGDVALNVARSGVAGRKLMLLHGSTGFWRTWLPVIPALENQFELILPDMRGSGASGHASPPAYGVMDQVRDILALVDAEPGDPLDLVGHSFGGHVAMCVAALRPQRVRRLLLEDAPLMVAGGRLQGRPAGPGFSAWLSILCTRPDAPELMEAIVREYPDMTGPQRRMRLQSLMALDPMLLDVYVNGAPFAGYDPHDLAPRVMCPALVLQADPAREARIDDEAAQLFCDLAPIATRRVMEGAGHGIHTDQPEVFVGILRGFLDG